MNNPLKSQIAANRERFETGSYFVFPSTVTHAQGTTRVNEFIFEGEAFNIEEEFKTSQTSLLQTAIAAVEDMLKKAREDYREYGLQSMEGEISGYSKVVELLKGGIEII